MNNIVSVIKDDLCNQTLVIYEDGSIEKLSRFIQKPEAKKEIACVIKNEQKEPILVKQPSRFIQKEAASKEIICVVKDDERKHLLVVYDDGSREYIAVLK